MGLQGVDRTVDLCREYLAVDCLTQAGCGVDENHRERMSLTGQGGQVFGREQTWSVGITLHEREEFEGALGIRPLTRGDGVFGHGDDGEAL